MFTLNKDGYDGKPIGDSLENILRRRASAMHKVGVEIDHLANEIVHLSDESKKTLAELINLKGVQARSIY